MSHSEMGGKSSCWRCLLINYIVGLGRVVSGRAEIEKEGN